MAQSSNILKSSRSSLIDDCLFCEKINDYLITEKKIKISQFPSINLFFGGVNAVTQTEAISDPRRGGYGISC